MVLQVEEKLKNLLSGTKSATIKTNGVEKSNDKNNNNN